MKKVKKLVSMLLTVSVLCLPISVCAKESTASELPSQEVVTVMEQTDADAGIEPRAVGKVLATGTTTINGGCGTLTITLPSGNWWADVSAGIGYTDQQSVVTCTVTTPDGDVISLGSMVGTGSNTGTQQLTYAPAGQYHFYFTSAITTPYKVIAYIYD